MKLFAHIGWVLLLALNACALKNEQNAVLNRSGASGSGFEAFKRSVYPLVLNQCASCHGNGTGPQFAVDDPSASYSLSRLYANFAQFSQSKFVQRTKDGHCGSDCSTDGAEMTAAIATWWNEGEAFNTDGLVAGDAVETPPQLIPAVLPTGSTYVSLQWDLASVTPALAGVRFQIEIQQFDTESYRVRNPKLTTGGFIVEVADIRVLMNGLLDESGVAYEFLHLNVPANTIRTLSASPMLVLADKGAGLDTLAISFGLLKGH